MNKKRNCCEYIAGEYTCAGHVGDCLFCEMQRGRVGGCKYMGEEEEIHGLDISGCITEVAVCTNEEAREDARKRLLALLA